MRKNATSSRLKTSTLCQFLFPALSYLHSTVGFDVNICRHADVVSTKILLTTLMTAVESYLGMNICFARLSLDDMEERKVSVVQEALQALSLRQVSPTLRNAKLMVYANMPDTLPRFDEEPWVVLVVDYSFHWFNVGLYTIDEGIVDPIEGTVRGPRIGENNQLDALQDSLTHLLANPPQNVNLPKQIRQLVVYGDDSKNAALYRLLAKILDTNLVRDAHISSSIYNGVTSLARNTYKNKDWVDFEMTVKPTFACRWRSKLYQLRDHNEL